MGAKIIEYKLIKSFSNLSS